MHNYSNFLQNNFKKDNQQDFNLGLNIFIAICLGSHFLIFPLYICAKTIEFMYLNML